MELILDPGADNYQNKFEILSPYLRRHGNSSMSYATLQDGLSYFLVEDIGYISFVYVKHFVFARRGMHIIFGNPVCDKNNYKLMIELFLSKCPHICFCPVDEECANTLRSMNFKANCVGYDPILSIQSYKTEGNWKELENIRRARNEIAKNNIVVKELAEFNQWQIQCMKQLSEMWLRKKIINDREIWIFARHPVFSYEQDVRKFLAFDQAEKIIGFAFYDPIYTDGKVIGYAANMVRTDEVRFSKLTVGIHMAAIDIFKKEGMKEFNLCLAPFDEIEKGKYNDDRLSKIMFNFSRKYGDGVYNFKGLSFAKRKYNADKKYLYFLSNGIFPSNDIYLTYLAANISKGYFSMLGKLIFGFFKIKFRH